MTIAALQVLRAMRRVVRVVFLDERSYPHSLRGINEQRWEAPPARSLFASVTIVVLLLAGEQRGLSRDFEVARTLQANGAYGWDKTLAFSPDSKLLVIASNSVLGLRVWDLERDKERVFLDKEGKRFSFRIRCVGFSPDGKTLAIAGFGYGIRLLDVNTGKEREMILGKIIERPNSVVFAPDGPLLVIAYSGMAILWDLARHSERMRISISGGGRERTAIAPDCRTLATCGRDGIRIWHLDTGKQAALLQAVESPCIYQPLRLAPDGNLLAVGGTAEEKIQLWSLETKKRIAMLECPSREVWWRPPAFSRDGRTLAVIDSKGALHLWEIATRSERAILRGDKIHIGPLAFSPESHLLASGCVEGSNGKKYSIVVWDLSDVKRKPPEAEEIHQLWTALRGDDAVVAYRAIRTLTAFPAQTLPLLRKQLSPLPIAGEESRKLEAWVADLDSDEFATREKANQKLEQAGLRAEGTLHKALAKHPSLELRQRVVKLLEGIDRQKNITLIQQARAVEVLEHIGTAEVRAMLADLAKGLPEARLTQEAKASLARLKKRPVAKH